MATIPGVDGNQIAVQSTVIIQTPVSSEVGFGIPIVIGLFSLSSTVISITASDDLSTLGLTATAIAQITAMFAQTNAPDIIKAGELTSGTWWTFNSTDLDDIKNYDDSWYWLLLDSGDGMAPTDANLTVVRDWIQLTVNQPRMAVLQSSESDIIGATPATSVFGIFNLADNDRVVPVYDATDINYWAARNTAFAGSANPDTNSNTWNMSALTGVTATNYDGTIQSKLEGISVNWVSRAGGSRNLFFKGTTSKSNLYVDQRVTGDWFAVRLQERLVDYLVGFSTRQEKAPYSDKGFQGVAAVVTELYQRGVRVGHFLENTLVINMPTLDPNGANPVTAQDKIDRKLTFDLTMEGLGAIHTIDVTTYLQT